MRRSRFSVITPFFAFQSTHPMRGATETMIAGVPHVYDFNPRTPCGVRPATRQKSRAFVRFQSTHPMRGATYRYIGRRSLYHISIHAPHAGCDIWHIRRHKQQHYFNPRTPCGVRRMQQVDVMRKINISIHAPHAGCDSTNWSRSIAWLVFQSTHPMRGATLESPF